MLDICWVAEFQNEPLLYQYEAEKENLFKEVLDKQDKLVRFVLYNRLSDDVFVADLTNGCLYYIRNREPFLMPREDMLKSGGIKYRLIYFREVERHFNATLQEVTEPNVLYFLGIQYTDADGSNRKKLMRIHPDGRWVIC